MAKWSVHKEFDIVTQHHDTTNVRGAYRFHVFSSEVEALEFCAERAALELSRTQQALRQCETRLKGVSGRLVRARAKVAKDAGLCIHCDRPWQSHGAWGNECGRKSKTNPNTTFQSAASPPVEGGEGVKS